MNKIYYDNVKFHIFELMQLADFEWITSGYINTRTTISDFFDIPGDSHVIRYQRTFLFNTISVFSHNSER